MLSRLPAIIQLEVAILFTSLAWGLGFYLVSRRVYLVNSLATGCFVCLIGYTAVGLGAPVWGVIAAPLPVDFAMLWYVMRTPRRMAMAYPAIWAIYVLLHIGLSATIRYDDLLPAWHLHR